VSLIATDGVPHQVREALDESRERLSAMAEELAATKTALFQRERELQSVGWAFLHPPAIESATRGGGGFGIGIISGLLGCVSLRVLSRLSVRDGI